MKIYLSGPMTGMPDYNMPEFDRVAGLLHKMGHQVYNPADTNDDFLQDRRRVWVQHCTWIINEAQALVYLPGSEKSVGAQVEIRLAEAMDVPCIPWNKVHASDL